jgi:hypothetical protein
MDNKLAYNIDDGLKERCTIETIICLYTYIYMHVYMYTGWAINRGLLFAGPPLLPLGGCEQKD